MKAIVEIGSGIAPLLYDDAAEVVLTSRGLLQPEEHLGVKSSTHEVITIDAPAKWVPGGVMSIVNGAWVINDQTAYDAYEVPVEPITYKVITPTFYLEFIQDVAQMTTADFAAYETDQHPDMIYTRAMHRSISGMIDVNIPSNMNLAMKGLNFMAAHGHTGQIAPADFTDTILAAWATL